MKFYKKKIKKKNEQIIITFITGTTCIYKYTVYTYKYEYNIVTFRYTYLLFKDFTIISTFIVVKIINFTDKLNKFDIMDESKTVDANNISSSSKYNEESKTESKSNDNIKEQKVQLLKEQKRFVKKKKTYTNNI